MPKAIAREVEFLTGSGLGARLPFMKRQRVLLAPATRSPKRAAIRAAVEEVAAERERLAAAEKKTAGQQAVSETPSEKQKNPTGSVSRKRSSSRRESPSEIR